MCKCEKCIVEKYVCYFSQKLDNYSFRMFMRPHISYILYIDRLSLGLTLEACKCSGSTRTACAHIFQIPKLFPILKSNLVHRN